VVAEVVALDLDVLAASIAAVVAAPLDLDVLAAVSGSGGVPAPRRWSRATRVAWGSFRGTLATGQERVVWPRSPPPVHSVASR
jgi:hypothetical protein